MIVTTNAEQEQIVADIDCVPTNDTIAPVKIEITSRDNLLLLFRSNVTSDMALKMAQRLLMPDIKPVDIPKIIQRLVEEHNSQRSFRLIAESQTQYLFAISDQLQDSTRQIFPRLSLPMEKQGPQVVQIRLKEVLEAQFKDSVNNREQIRDLTERFNIFKEQQERMKTETEKQMGLLQEKLDQKTRELAELQQRSTQDSARLAQENAALKKDLEFTTGLKDKFDQQLLQQSNQLAQTNEKLRQAELSIQTLTVRLQKADAENSQKQMELDQLASNKTKLVQQTHERDLELERLRTEAKAAGEEVKLTRDQRDTLQQRFDQLRQDSSTQISELQNELQLTKAQLQGETNRARGLEENVKYLQQEHQKANEGLQKAVTQIEQLLHEQEILKSDLEAANTRNASLETSNATKTEELSRIQKEAADAQAQIPTLQAQIDEWRQRAEAAEAATGAQVLDQLVSGRPQPQQDAELEQILTAKVPPTIPPRPRQSAGHASSILDDYRYLFSTTDTKSVPPVEKSQKSDGRKYVDLSSLIADTPVQLRSNRATGVSKPGSQVSTTNTKADLKTSSNTKASFSTSGSIQIPEPASATYSEASSGTRQLVSHYMKGGNGLGEQSSTSEDAIFAAMKDVSYEPFKPQTSQKSLQETKHESQQPDTQKNSSGMLEKYLNMINQSLGLDE